MMDFMVLEIAEFNIRAGDEDDFAAAYRKAVELLECTEGFRSARMTQGIEIPTRFVLLVEWDTLSAHVQGFRESPRYGRWRELISPYFADTPLVQHAVDI